MYKISAERLDLTARQMMEAHSSAVWDRCPPAIQGRYRERVINTICALLEIRRTDIEIVAKVSDIIARGDDEEHND